MPKYRAGVIGCGRMGSTIDDEMIGSNWFLPHSHAASYKEAEKTELVAAADIDEAKLKAFSERWGVTALYTDYKEMLAKENLDIVSVTTKTVTKPEIVINAAKAGVKGIYCEKPIADVLREAEEMIAVCKEFDVKFAINASLRWEAFYSKAKEIIEQGVIGNLSSIVAYSVGALSHMGSHLLDIVRFYADADADWVMGHMDSEEKSASNNDLIGSGYIWFKNGVRAFINMSAGKCVTRELDLVGDKGRIRALNDTRFELWVGNGRELVMREFPRPQWIKGADVRAVEDIVNCIENGGQPKCSGEDGKASLEIAIAMRESHRREKRIYLPLENKELAMISGA